MKDNKHIKSFNEHQEKLDISNVMNSSEIITAKELELRKKHTFDELKKQFDEYSDEELNRIVDTFFDVEIKHKHLIIEK